MKNVTTLIISFSNLFSQKTEKGFGIALFALFALVMPKPVFSQQGACVRVEWSKNYGGFFNEAANKVIQTSDDGFLAVGYSRSSNMMVTQNKGKSDFWIAKTDSLGNLEWQSSYGGSENDIASDALQTPDGGYLVVGGTSSFEGDVVGSHGEEDVWLLKLNATGGLVWSKTFGGTLNERMETIIPTSDGNYLMAGYTNSNNGDIGNLAGDFDYWLVKIDGNGNLIWENTFGGFLADWGFDVKETPDGGFMVTGSTISNDSNIPGNNGFYDYYIVRTDAAGNLIWSQTFGGTLEERSYALELTTDGGAIIAGTSNSANWDVPANFGNYDLWLIRIAADGSLVWSRNFGGNSEDRAFSITALQDGNYLVAGFTASSNGVVSGNNGSFDGWVLKIDPNGNLIWEKNLGGTDEDRLYSIIELPDGGYTAAGFAASSNLDLPGNFGEKDLWILNLSPDSLSFSLGNDTTLCLGDNLVLQVQIDDVTYLWSDGSTLPFLSVSTTGEYWLELDLEGCKTRDTILVEYLTDTPLALGNDTTLCAGDTLLLELDFPGATYTWRDGSNGPAFLVTIPGIYWASVKKDGCEQKDTISVNFAKIEIGFDETAFLCHGESLALDVERPNGVYLWQDGSTEPRYVVDGPGTFWVRVREGGCSGTDSIVVDFQPGPDSLFADTSFLCEGQGLWLEATYPGATYLWQDGSVDQRLKAVVPGLYSVSVTINNCIFENEIQLLSCERCLYIPNIFSPNGDGINDEFRTFPACDLLDYHHLVFDRWGNIVFETKATDQHWDGLIKGKLAQAGVYTYLFRYVINSENQLFPQQRQGTVTLVR